ncbi:MAG: hypothetical protein J0I20_31225 [Chloroflexi bacterium]|nr:hypothetical protein [Chloroflexota bacterium]OJV94044.1 MAG: hypothetical protein BGO39_06960 [Chloroflexi bacterium 54-19]
MLKLATSFTVFVEIYQRLVEALPDLDIKKVQDNELEWIPSPSFIGRWYVEPELRWAAREGRILITDELDRINIKVFYSNLDKGKKVPGLFIVSTHADLDTIVNDLLLVIQASSNEEWDEKLLYIPIN